MSRFCPNIFQGRCDSAKTQGSQNCHHLSKTFQPYHRCEEWLYIMTQLQSWGCMCMSSSKTWCLTVCLCPAVPHPAINSNMWNQESLHLPYWLQVYWGIKAARDLRGERPLRHASSDGLADAVLSKHKEVGMDEQWVKPSKGELAANCNYSCTLLKAKWWKRFRN